MLKDGEDKYGDVTLVRSSILNLLPLLIGTGTDYGFYENLYFCNECYDGVNTNFGSIIHELRRMNLLFKADIQRYDLMENMMEGYHCNREYSEKIFEESTFRHLVNWDPIILTQVMNLCDEALPLHLAARNFDGIVAFSIVLELGINIFAPNSGFFPTSKAIA